MATAARVVAIVVLMGAACHGGASEPKAVDAVSSAAADGATSLADAAPSPLDAPALDVVLFDPKLAVARERLESGDYSGAALAIADARAKEAPDEKRACRWDYVEGRMHMLASESELAAAAFDRAGGSAQPSACTLAPYARLRSSQHWLKKGSLADAAARAALVPEDLALAMEAKLVLADALSMQGDPARATSIWRDYLHAHPKDGRWVEVAAKLANARANAGDAKEAFDLATRVVMEAPALETTSGALATRSKTLSMDASLAASLDAEQKAKRAQAWLDSGHGDTAFAEASALLKGLPAQGGDHALRCKVATTRAQASAKTKSSTADAWEDAVKACDVETDALAAALYNAAKAQASKAPKTAIAHFSELERRFPKSNLADDARLRGAALVREGGDLAGALAMLEKLPDDYPSGDMRSEALFRAALAKYGKSDWDGAIALLDRGVAMDGADRHWATSGRSAYFRARTAEKKGDREGAKARYATVIAERPLAYFMLLSYSRLYDLDPELAKKSLADAEAREADGAILSRERPETTTAAFARATSLLEVGEVDAAKKEMVLAGALSDGADAELVWLAATLFDRAGAPEIGSAMSRGRVQDHLAHYPKGRYRAMWEAAFPKAFEAMVVDRADANHVPRALTWGIMREESAFYPEATSPSPAFGLMQLIASTAKQTAAGTSLAYDEASLKRPAVSIALGTKLLGSLRATFPSDPALAIPAYNGGPGAVGRWLAARGGEDLDQWVEEIPWEETRGYTKRVLASVAAYAYLYERATVDEVLRLPVRADGSKP